MQGTLFWSKNLHSINIVFVDDFYIGKNYSIIINKHLFGRIALFIKMEYDLNCHIDSKVFKIYAGSDMKSNKYVLQIIDSVCHKFKITSNQITDVYDLVYKLKHPDEAVVQFKSNSLL
jgi:hypothetical protein